MRNMEAAVAYFNALKAFLDNDDDCYTTTVEVLEMTPEEEAEFNRLVKDW